MESVTTSEPRHSMTFPQAHGNMPHPLPLSPNTSSHTGHYVTPTADMMDTTSDAYGQRSGLLTPNTGSAAVSPSLGPHQPTLPPKLHHRMATSSSTPMTETPNTDMMMYDKHYTSSMSEGHSMSGRTLPPSQTGSPERNTFHPIAETTPPANITMPTSQSGTVLPPISSLSLGTTTPNAGTPTARRSPVTPAAQIPSLSAAANTALAEHHIRSAIGHHDMPYRIHEYPHAYTHPSGMNSMISSSAPVTRCPSPRTVAGHGTEMGVEPVDHRFGEAMQRALMHHCTGAASEKISHHTSMENHPMQDACFAQRAASGHLSHGAMPISAGGVYRSGAMSMPGSPTHRPSHGSFVARPTPRQSETPAYGQPYDLAMRKRSRTRQNSLEQMSDTSISNSGVPTSNVSQTGPTNALPQSVPVSATSSTASNISISSITSTTTNNNNNTVASNAPNSPNSLSALDRLRRRRENHNHVERRRRDHINGTIRALAALLPDRGCGPDGQRRNKGAILESAVEWLREVQRENMALREENLILRERCGLVAPGTAAAYIAQQQQQQQQELASSQIPTAVSHPALPQHMQPQPSSGHGMPMPVSMLERAVSAPNPRTTTNMEVTSSSSREHPHHVHPHPNTLAHTQPPVPTTLPATHMAPAPQLPSLSTIFSKS
jgi:hypothetical protein